MKKLILITMVFLLLMACTPDNSCKVDEADLAGITDYAIDEEEIITEEIQTAPEPSLVKNDSLKSAEFVATAYCSCEKCCGKWASMRGDGPVVGAIGVPLVHNVSVGIDPKVIPYNTVLRTEDGHEYIAHDTGGAIKGYRIDVYMNSHEEAIKFGKKTITLTWEE